MITAPSPNVCHTSQYNECGCVNAQFKKSTAIIYYMHLACSLLHLSLACVYMCINDIPVDPLVEEQRLKTVYVTQCVDTRAGELKYISVTYI